MKYAKEHNLKKEIIPLEWITSIIYRIPPQAIFQDKIGKQFFQHGLGLILLKTNKLSKSSHIIDIIFVLIC